jgi:hypothetical protein
MCGPDEDRAKAQSAATFDPLCTHFEQRRQTMKPRTQPLWMGIALAGLLLPVGASAQSRWTVQGNSSLAWWQINPNEDHLWATTCPADPDWRPGANRSAGWAINPALQLPSHGADVSDTVHVPVFPRYEIRHLCVDALQGEFTVADPAHWSGIRGWLTVRSDDIVVGDAWDDETMHEVLGASSFPDIRFTIDSVVDMSQHGDTLVGRVAGTMALRGTTTPMLAAVTALPDSGGLRVFVKWRIPAKELNTLTPSLAHISLGLDSRIWKDFFMGADIVLRPMKNVALGPATAR